MGRETLGSLSFSGGGSGSSVARLSDPDADPLSVSLSLSVHDTRAQAARKATALHLPRRRSYLSGSRSAQLPKSIAPFGGAPARCTTVGWSAPAGLYPGGKAAGDGEGDGDGAGEGDSEGMRFHAGAAEEAEEEEEKSDEAVGCSGGKPDEEGVVVDSERL